MLYFTFAIFFFAFCSILLSVLSQVLFVSAPPVRVRQAFTSLADIFPWVEVITLRRLIVLVVMVSLSVILALVVE
jgi:hypothetical protein